MVNLEVALQTCVKGAYFHFYWQYMSPVKTWNTAFSTSINQASIEVKIYFQLVEGE